MKLSDVIEGRLGDPEMKGPPYTEEMACEEIARAINKYLKTVGRFLQHDDPVRRITHITADEVDAWREGDGSVWKMNEMLEHLGIHPFDDYGNRVWNEKLRKAFEKIGVRDAKMIADVVHPV